MDNVLDKRSSRSGMLWLTASICVFTVIYIIMLNSLCSVPVRDSILYFAAQLIFVLLPGMCLLLYINPPKSKANYLIVSYMLGIGIMILQSFLYGAFHLTNQSLIGMGIISALSVWGIYRKKEDFFGIFKSKHAERGFSLFILTAVILIITAAFGVSVYKTPDLMPNGISYIYHDLLWNVGNTVSLANGLPVSDIHVSGFTFGYHYFINAFLAPFFNTLGITAFNLYIKLLPTATTIVLCGGFYMLIGSLFKNKAAAAVISFIALLCCAGVLTELMWYVPSSPLCIGITAAALYYFIKLLKRFDSAKISDPDFIVFFLLLLTATGIKTLIAAPLIAGAGITILAQIIVKRRNIKNMLIMGIVILFSVIAIYLIFVYGTHAFNSLQRAFFSLMWISGEPWYYAAALAQFPNLPEIAVKALTYPIYLVITYPVLAAALILLFICLIKKKGGFYIPLFLFSGIIIGLIAASATYQPGSSNMYFITGALPLCIYGLLFIILNVGLNKAAKTTLIALTAVILAYSSFLTLNELTYNYNEALPYRARSGGGSPYDTINFGEYEGMLWIRDNTDRSDIIASDRIYYSPVENLNEARYYYYTAFSERPYYLEGYNYISTHTENYEQVIEDKLDVLNRAYRNDPKAVKSLYEDGVKYLTVSRFYHPDFILDKSLGSEVFSNDAVAIYRLNDFNS